MRPLRLDLLGGFTLCAPGDVPCPLSSKKAQALLAYLALPPGRAHSREKLTALLWGDTPEAQARQAFRQTLSRLRRALVAVTPDALVDRSDTIALRADRVLVDVTEFEVALAADSPQALARAVELYRGDLLEGVEVGEPTFDEWRTVERERLRELALEALARLLRHYMSTDLLDAAVRTALRILALDPLEEAVHRALMRLYVRQGRRAAALRQYQECVQTLHRELGAEPEEPTRELYRQLLRGGHAETDGPPTPAGVEGLRPARGTRGPLIGRRDALAELAGSLERALNGGARVVLLSGEAGAGKTRLLEDLADDVLARGGSVVVGRSWETEQALPLRPWIEALRSAPSMRDPGLLAHLTVGARLQLGRVLPELTTGHELPATVGDSPQLFDAIAELTRLLGADRPLLIVLEDLHWADAMSVRLLAFLARRLGPLAVLIAASIRPEESAAASVLEPALAELRSGEILDEIAVDPLSREETLALARALWPGGRSAAAVDRIADDLWSISEGNPFVVAEAVRGLVDSPRGAPERRELMPRSVREAIASRLGRLPEPCRRVVAIAAVVNRAFSLPLLCRAAGLGEEEAAHAVEELVRRRVLDTLGERLDFCHVRIRDVAYDDLLPARRSAVHGAVARALAAGHPEELDEVADQLGYHYLQAGEVEQAIPHLTRFAEIAAQRYALESALATLQDAEKVVDRLPAARRDACRLDIVLRQAFVLAVSGRQSECLDILQRHADLQRRVPDPALASEYFFRLAMTHAYLSDAGQSRPAGDAALRAAEESGEPERVGKALYALAAGSYGAGFPQDAIGYSSRALGYLEHPHSRHWRGLAYWNLATNQMLIGDFEAAVLNAGRCAEVAEALGDSRLKSMAGYIEAWVRASRGEYPSAIVCAQRALEVARDPIARNLALLALGYAHLQARNASAAHQIFEDVLKRIDSAPVRLSLERALAMAAEAALLCGDRTGAAERAARAFELARTSGNRFSMGIAERAQGRVLWAAGDADGAAALLSQAIDSLQAFGARFEMALARVDLARVLAAQGDRAAAQAHLGDAIAVLDAAGASPRVNEAHELARALTTPAPSP